MNITKKKPQGAATPQGSSQYRKSLSSDISQRFGLEHISSGIHRFLAEIIVSAGGGFEGEIQPQQRRASRALDRCNARENDFEARTDVT